MLMLVHAETVKPQADRETGTTQRKQIYMQFCYGGRSALVDAPPSLQLP
jgi:hypothetical protein